MPYDSYLPFEFLHNARQNKMTSIWRDSYTLAVPESAASTDHVTIVGDVLALNSSRSIVAYRTSYEPGNGSTGIYFRFVDPFGNDLGSEKFVASMLDDPRKLVGTGNLGPPEATVLSNGDIVVSWLQFNNQPFLTPTRTVHARVFSEDGTPLSSAIEVGRSFSTENEISVKAVDQGFEVVWTRGVSSEQSGVSRAAFDFTGNKIGSTTVLQNQSTSCVDTTQLADGSNVMVWGYDRSIFVQKYSDAGTLIGSAKEVLTFPIPPFPSNGSRSVMDSQMQITQLSNGELFLVYSTQNIPSAPNRLTTYTAKLNSNFDLIGAPTFLANAAIDFPINSMELDVGQNGQLLLKTASTLIRFNPLPREVLTLTQFDSNGNFIGQTTTNMPAPQFGGPTSRYGVQETISATMLNDGRILTVGTATTPADTRGFLQASISDFRTTQINGTENADVLVGRTGNDAMANDIMWGLDGNDSLYGMLGNDTLDGGAGDDVVSGNEGNDVLVLGDGNDYAYVGTNTVQDYAYGGNGNDVLVGDVGAVDVLLGDAGNDTIYGGAGAVNYMFSGSGNNVMVGGATTVDVFYSEGTNDIIQAATAQSLTYRLAAGTSVLIGGTGIDQFIGGTFASNDTVNGGAGADYLYGGSGNDLLSGGADNDVILGQAGNDTLEGGAGVNLLWANDAGSDQILVNVANGGTQVVDFFEAGGTNDVVRLLGSSLTGFARYEALLANIGNAVGANLLLNTGTGAQLYLNLGANQTAIWFQGVSAYSLTSSDFLFA
jgi:Ca2+-binding RTX toxin-like protein